MHQIIEENATKHTRKKHKIHIIRCDGDGDGDDHIKLPVFVVVHVNFRGVVLHIIFRYCFRLCSTYFLVSIAHISTQTR